MTAIEFNATIQSKLGLIEVIRIAIFTSNGKCESF